MCLDNEKIIARIRELKGDESENAMAKRLGISQVTLNYCLAGKRKPSLELVYIICSKFGVSTDWLLGLSDVRTTTQSVESPMMTTHKRQNLQRDDVVFELSAIRRQLEQQQREIAALKELHQTTAACCG